MNEAHDEASMALALAGIEKVWDEARRSLFIQREQNAPIDRLPDISEAAVAAHSARAAEALRLMAPVDAAALPTELALTLALARSTAERMAKEAERYWLVLDPLGVGFFGMFAPTAYCGGMLLSHASSVMDQHPFDAHGDVDRYGGLVADYARLIDQMLERTLGQADRGVRMPQVQLAQSIELVTRLRAARVALIPGEDRLARVGGTAPQARIAERIEALVEPAFTRLLDYLSSSDYAAAAPTTVGLAQYEGGSALYAQLVHEHTTLHLTPAEVHAKGLARIAAIRVAMDDLIAQNGFNGTAHDYLAAIGRDPQWRAEGAEAIGAVFRRYIDRIAPHIDAVFRFKPKAPHGAQALPSALSGSMTFGYYDPPNPRRAEGLFFFNAENLSNGPLANVAALNYHELVPGHHFHIASQRENPALHPLRANAFINAYNEGWAEYAATLAGELGMYEAPQERFGRLIMDAFLSCRLVVDTGMNALGWSLEQARDFMRENSFMPETEIRSESIRYSCDIPGQSLAYKLADDFLMDQREAMRSRLGARFDLRDFHDAVLKPGALPLPLVAQNVERATRLALAQA